MNQRATGAVRREPVPSSPRSRLVAAACGQRRRRRPTRRLQLPPRPLRPERPRPPPQQSHETTEAAADTTLVDGEDTDAAAIDPERCATNEAVGTITYLSSFDFAAAASIVDVVVAEDKGYFDELCLDVELTPELLDVQLPARRRRPGAVLLRRQLHRDPQLHR